MTKLYHARFIKEGDRAGDDIRTEMETRDFQAILDYGRENDMTSCVLAEADVTDVDGMQCRSETQELCGTIYFNVQNIKTRSEMIKDAPGVEPELQKIVAPLIEGDDRLRKLFDKVFNEGKSKLLKDDPSSMYVTKNNGKQVKLRACDQAYDRRGNRVFPRPYCVPNPKHYF